MILVIVRYACLMTEELSGYVDVNVHDKVWAEVHLGLIDERWDLFLAEICYKARLSYSTNIMKVINLLQDVWDLSLSLSLGDRGRGLK